MNWINGNKAFYLLGIRTAVNEMYKRFEKIFRQENTALLHGEISWFLADETDAESVYFEKMSKARQYSYPITVATADQLVTSVFKYNGFELPYLTASYSKIVIDEIQSFSPESIAAIVVFLKEIHSLGGKFLLMTATLPAFIRKEFEKLDNTVFPKPELSRIKRHRIQCISKYIEDDTEQIELFAKQNKKVLVICNTVNKSQDLYEKLEDYKPKLLHSRFIHKDRIEKEAEIMKATVKTNTQGSIWITTQIVEASLDIDFDVLFTECATVDSIFQRFGRCYRQREYDKDIPNIFIYLYDKNTRRIYDSEITEKTWEILQKSNHLLLTEQDKQDMIGQVFSNIEDTKYYQKYKAHKELLEFGIRAKNKAEAEWLFRNILNNYVIIPEPVYKENQQEIESLIECIDSGKDLSLLDKIKKKKKLLDYSFSAQIYKSRHELLREIPSDFCREHHIFLLKGVEYTYEKGLVFLKDYKDFDNFIM